MPHSIFAKTNVHSVFPKLEESPALYATNTIKGFALSLVGIFIPVYIYTLENKPIIYSDSHINSVGWVLIYYLITGITLLISSSELTNSIFGFLTMKNSIFISTILQSIMLLSLSLADKYFYLIFLAGILTGLESFLYWIPYHTLFIRKSRNKEKGHFGNTVATRILLGKLARTIGPIMGGFIISIYSFNLLFFIGILLLSLSSIPVLVSVDESKHGKHNVWHIFKKYISRKELRKKSVAMAANGIEDIIYATMWPILLFVALKSFSKLGTLVSISIFISSLTVVLVGKFIDKHGVRKVLKIGLTIDSLLYVFRMFVTTPSLLFAIDITDRINGPLRAIPFLSVYYNIAEQEGTTTAELIIYRELIKWLSIIIVILLILIILPLLPTWQYIFIVPAIVAPFMYLIVK